MFVFCLYVVFCACFFFFFFFFFGGGGGGLVGILVGSFYKNLLLSITESREHLTTDFPCRHIVSRFVEKTIFISITVEQQRRDPNVTAIYKYNDIRVLSLKHLNTVLWVVIIYYK